MPRQLQQPTCRGSVRPARQMQRITAAASLSDQDSEKRAAKERWQTQVELNPNHDLLKKCTVVEG